MAEDEIDSRTDIRVSGNTRQERNVSLKTRTVQLLMAAIPVRAGDFHWDGQGGWSRDKDASEPMDTKGS